MDQQTRREIESRCIQDCAPACGAACPVHVDVRAVAAALGRGEADTALAVLMQSVPFPGIISRVCDRPCEDRCVYGGIGSPISIRAIERSCVDHGTRPDAPRRRAPRDERVAVVGGGISGLTAAHDLARKGYRVTVFEAGDRLGGSLWKTDRDYLPAEVIEADLAVIAELGVDVRLGADVSIPVEQLLHDVDAVYVATGPSMATAMGLPTDERGTVVVDPVTFATPLDGVFAGGGIRWGPEMHSSITSISEARRAAISIDRFLQEVSLTASRDGEGPYESCLFTNLERVVPQPRIEMGHPDDGYEWYEAMLEAQRCIQCECMECVRACDYLEQYGRYPKKYVREVYNNLSIVKGTRHANTFINSCSACGLCAEVCPTDVDMGAVMLDARATMVEQGKMPPSAHDFALRDMAFSMSDACATARNAPGTTSSQYVLFPGCQLSASSPEHVQALYVLLGDGLDGDVGLLLGCCGAPARWAGRRDLFDATVAHWRRALAELGDPTVVLPCSSCHQVFSTALPDVAFVSAWELLEREGLLPQPVASSGTRVAIHDPCTTRNEPGIHDAVRRTVERLGLEIDELANSRERTTCCSFGGHQWLVDPELADRVVARRIAESDADFVTYCAMCRDVFAGKGKRTLHVLDLLFADGAEAVSSRAERPAPGWSQRHEQRARLKRTMLREIWGEHMDGETDDSIEIRMTDDVVAVLERRLILLDDVRQVLAEAQRTGRHLVNAKTGRWLASHRPAAVTYWVEYLPEDDAAAFRIFNAYSHRMETPGTGP